MSANVIVVTHTGLSASIQDDGRAGFARFGVPPSGAMDDHAAGWANRLVRNTPATPVIELLMQGAELRVVADAWLAITGGDAGCGLPLWRAVRVRAGETIVFPASRSGLWTYVAVEGGFDVPRYFGSASVYPRGRIGTPLSDGDILRQRLTEGAPMPSGVAARTLTIRERRDYAAPPPLRVWRGPQWELFSAAVISRFFEQIWTVSPRSDRVGYRLDGPDLSSSSIQIPSEPVLVGSIQVPPDGRPIVTMRDGPTVGGYPKIGLIDPDDVSRLAQCRPGTPVRFEPIGE